MNEEERRKTLLEVGFAIGVVGACVFIGIWLASLGPVDSQHFDSPDEPLPRATSTMPPLHRDTFTAGGSSTPRPKRTATQEPTAEPTSRAESTPRPRPTREVAPPPSRPAPVGTRSPSAAASPAPVAPPVCRLRVAGICLVR